MIPDYLCPCHGNKGNALKEPGCENFSTVPVSRSRKRNDESTRGMNRILLLSMDGGTAPTTRSVIINVIRSISFLGHRF